ncbi:hypothetical protein L6452_03903 [Arctium lappa]|uniref:Uncharacterized protein n=1 Tax=Arctium lappa TaxID=4217 RepID=A0ACB9FNI9_ARCLA|nr:hypothetical protein L6452_03903 [Arctium lappa]
MGKGEDEPLPTTITHSQSTPRNADNCSSCCARIASLFRFRCVFVLVLGLSVLLSAVFWLPPFFRHGDQGDLDLDSHYKGHDIVATFMVQKPLSLLEDDFPRLGGDIFDEIRVPTTKVVIITAESIARPNTTKVIFGVDPAEYNSKISPYAKSLIRASFESLVLRQSSLSLTESLFGEPSSFEVLKFVGGITVTPVQSAYPLQKVQILFNFTLNFSIEQILDNFNELTSQLKSGLHLATYENLYVSLSNPKGSTVAPPTTVQSSVVLVVGTPSMARLKQLTQTIKGSPTKNLGLNNTQFGKVKQISLSSILQHSLNGSSGGGTPTPSPAPLPQPPPQPHDNHHHHHHHHHNKQLPPAKPPSPNERGGLKHSPAPSPIPTHAPHKIHNAKPPDCHSGYNRKKRSFKNANKHPPLLSPVSQPVLPPHTPPPPHNLLPPPPPPPPPSLPPPPRPKNLPPPPPPKFFPPPLPPPAPPSTPPPPAPRSPPPPSSPVPETIPASSPLPNVVFAHTQPPSKSDSDTEPPDMTPSGSILQPSSCAGVDLRGIPLFLVIVTVHLLQQK